MSEILILLHCGYVLPQLEILDIAYVSMIEARGVVCR